MNKARFSTQTFSLIGGIFVFQDYTFTLLNENDYIIMLDRFTDKY